MNKKNLLCVILVLFAAVLSFSFGGHPKEKAVGTICYYGNVPFEFPGFNTVDGFVYTIQVAEGASFSLDDITKEQGNLLEFTGKIDASNIGGYNVLKDGVFIVSDFEVLK